VLIEDKSPPKPLKEEGSSQSQLEKPSSPWLQKSSELSLALKSTLIQLYTFLISLLFYLPSWLIGQAYQPYDVVYASLPPISSFSQSSSIAAPLTLAFEVWRPNPRWKKRAPGPPDFHICVIDGRMQFPPLAQLEQLYNSVASKHSPDGRPGKVVLAVVDNGVSNYLMLDEKLLNVTESD
jgi:hypothetical protein